MNNRLSDNDDYIILDDRINNRQMVFNQPVDIFLAYTADQVDKAFLAMERARASGLYLAGYASYELGLVLEERLNKLIPPKMLTPLLCFGAFRRKTTATGLELTNRFASGAITEVKPAWSLEQYRQRFDKTVEYIMAGDIYQANISFPLYGRLSGDLLNIYDTLITSQPISYGAIVNLGRPLILSFSPELFFKVDDREILARPMKGTAARGKTAAEDEQIRRWLANDEKSRAENLMIVDLLRNDIAKISEVGSVAASDIFKLEQYRSLYQMTSQVHGKLHGDITIKALFTSLFPCGSVTGAPKIRAMEIIRQLEETPRNAYCGTIGVIEPDGDMCFNVAIRTMLILDDHRFIFNIGSAIVADSDCLMEYQECLLKARFLTSKVQA